MCCWYFLELIWGKCMQRMPSWVLLWNSRSHYSYRTMYCRLLLYRRSINSKCSRNRCSSMPNRPILSNRSSESYRLSRWNWINNNRASSLYSLPSWSLLQRICLKSMHILKLLPYWYLKTSNLSSRFLQRLFNEFSCWNRLFTLCRMNVLYWWYQRIWLLWIRRNLSFRSKSTICYWNVYSRYDNRNIYLPCRLILCQTRWI